MDAPKFWVRVVLDVPLPGPFDYCSHQPIAIGLRVIVPFGRRELVGLVVGNPEQPGFPEHQIKPVSAILDDLPALSAHWLRMAQFAAHYYQRPVGEVALPVLPGPLRKVSAYRGKRAGGGPVDRLLRPRLCL